MYIRFLLALSLLVICPRLSYGQEKKYSVEIRDAPTADVIRLLAQMEDNNVILPTKLEEAVTASFPSITLDDALTAVLESKNLGAIVKNRVIRVSTKKEMEALGEDLVTTTFPLKYAKAKEVKEQLTSLVSTRGSVMLDERTNALTVRDTATYVKNVAILIENIDKVDKQVLIEARIVEASTDFAFGLGIQWGISSTTGPLRISGPNLPGQPGSSQFMVNSAAGNPVAGLAVGLGPFSGIGLDIQLTAAEKDNKISILSRPSIVTMNNEAATISSTLKFSIKVPTGISVNTGAAGAGQAGASLQTISAGITMVVTPQITVDGKIRLAINVTQSQPDISQAAIDGIPVISDNSATTHVLLEDGETTVIGGMFQVNDSKTKMGLPGLHRIPILGALFGSTSESNRKRELLVFIKPSVVRKAIKQLTPGDQPL